MTQALIIIDMMQGYMSDTHNPKKVIENIVKLAKAFKKSKKKVILAIPNSGNNRKNPVMIKLWGDEIEENPGILKLVPEIEKIKFDKIIKKDEYSAFFNTDFEAYCKKNKITELYLTGVFSGACVYFTGVDAAYRMIQPYLVKDATGGPKKSLVSSSWNEKTLESFKLMIGPLVTTKQVEKNLMK